MHRRTTPILFAAALALSACGAQAQQDSSTAPASAPSVAAPSAAASVAAAESTAAAPSGASGGSGGEPSSEPSAEPSAEPSSDEPAAGGVYANNVTGEIDASIADLPHRVYVPNEYSNDVAVIDPETFEIVGRFPVGGAPEHISPDWDLSTLYVNNMNGASLTVVDPETEQPIETREVPFPYNLFFTPDGEKAIVVADYLGIDMVADNGLHFYDRETWEPLKFLQIPYPGVNHLDFSADGSYLLVTGETSGAVVRVDVETMEITGVIDVGGSPLDIRLAPEGDIFYVANQGTHGVDLVNGDTLEHVGHIPTRQGAHAFGFSRDVSKLFVTNRLDGSVSVIDTKTRQLVDTWQIGGSPDMVTTSPDGSQVWISNRFHGTVVVLNPDTGEVIRLIETGANPHGLIYWPQPGKISLGHNGNMR